MARPPIGFHPSEDKRVLAWHDVLAPHIEQTKARMRQHPVVLPVEWRLLTNRCAGTLDALELIDWYRNSFRVEIISI